MQRKGISKANVAYECVRDMIVSYKLAPGTQLSDYKLSQELAMSRSSIRDAILRLETDGLVRISDANKVIVSPVGLDDVLDILTVRCAVETQAIKLIARGGWLDRKIEEKLAGILREFRGIHWGMDFVSQHRLDDEFHRTIVREAGSPRLNEIFETASLQMQRARWLDMTDSHRQEQLADEHEAILSSLKGHDLERCLESYEAHLQSCADSYVAALASEQMQELAKMISNFFSDSNA